MIPINKSNEPASWTAHRTTPGAVYEPINELRMALLSEQGHICAYCMQRISHSAGNTATTKIDHILSQNDPIAKADKQTTMDYQNMVLCCSGERTINGQPFRHCDTAKSDFTSRLFAANPGSSFIQLLDPVKRHDLVTQIKYSNDGTAIWPQQAVTEGDEVFKLNCSYLKAARNQALATIRKHIEKEARNRTVTKSALSKLLTAYTQKDKDGKYRPFVGVYGFYLHKKLSQVGK